MVIPFRSKAEDVDQIARDFNNWLDKYGYEQNAMIDEENMILDFRAAYEVAPDLIMILRDIVDE